MGNKSVMILAHWDKVIPSGEITDRSIFRLLQPISGAYNLRVAKAQPRGCILTASSLCTTF